MASCQSVPTETQFANQVFTSNSLSTSFSTSVSTAPPTVVTSSSIVCLDTNASSPCTSTSLSVVLITNPGSTTTVSVPVVVTIPVTLTSSNPTKTLFSNLCSSSPTSSPTSTFTPSRSEITPQVTFTSASSSTLSNGSVVTTGLVLTSLLPPTSVYVTDTPPTFNSDKNSGSSSKVGPIVGGVVGGVVGLLALIGGILFIWRRSKRWSDIFDREADEKEQRRMTLADEDIQPRPYHYGLVGHSLTPTPPQSPPFRPQERSPGHSPSTSLSLLNAPGLHSRSSSAVDASQSSMSPSGSDLATVPAGHVRPNLSTASSTAASTVPLLERSVNPARPPSSWSADGQSIASGVELFNNRGRQPTPSSPRPHSASASLPSGAAAGVTFGAPSTSSSTGPSPVMGTRKLRGETLPMGAAAPIPPMPLIPSIPGSEAATSRSPPPLTPRSPHRTKSTIEPAVRADDRAGPVSDGQDLSKTANPPPAYSPT